MNIHTSHFAPSAQKGGTNVFGRDLVHYKHNFQESGLFSDDALASLIEDYPREYYMITTMNEQGGRRVWRNGDFNGASGKQVLEAILAGRLWLCLRRLDVVAPEYEALVKGGFKAVEADDADLATSRHKSSMLISSPGARVHYHADIPMVALWHIRGKKRVWLYDADDAEQLPDETLEGVILRETEEEIPYDPAWDKSATCIDLNPGWALSWPQNAPHRVDNLDGLNVSITTDYFTPRAQRKYGVYYYNGMMRRRFGMKPRSTSTEGLGAMSKCASSLMMKKIGMAKNSERDMIKTFHLDGDRPGHIIDLPEEQHAAIHQA